MSPTVERDGAARDGEASGEGDGRGRVLDEALEVESIAVGGDGVARQRNGRVVFVPRTAPGDAVTVRLVEEHGSYARAVPVEVVREGPGRRKAPCPYYEGCGGCQVQHLAYGAQLDAKRRAVRDTLERIGGLEIEVPPVAAAEATLGYRNRVTYTLRRRPEGVEAGYHRWDDPGRLVDVRHCPLAEAPIQRAWSQLRSAWGPGARHLPEGDELRVTLRASSGGEVTLVVDQGPPDGGSGGRGSAGRPGVDAGTHGPRGGRPGRDPGADAGVTDPDDGAASSRPAVGDPRAVAGAVDGLSGYFRRPSGGPRELLAGEARMEERWMGLDLSLGPETFLQVNRRMARRVEAWLDDVFRERRGGPSSGERVLDLYAGVGARAIRWAREGAEVATCEIEPEAVRCGRDAAGRTGARVEMRAAPVEEALGDLLPADVAVVNPPRAGVSERVAEALSDAPLEALAYVSCDPATLARDLRRLGGQWTVVGIRAFDAFPQTAHVETAAWLEPA